jgi:hypothetical protein
LVLPHLQICHYLFLLHPFQFIICSNPLIQRYVTSATDKISIKIKTQSTVVLCSCLFKATRFCDKVMAAEIKSCNQFVFTVDLIANN